MSGNHWHYEFNDKAVTFNNAVSNLNNSQCVSAQTSASRGEAYAMLTSTDEANVGRSGYSGNHSHTIQTIVQAVALLMKTDHHIKSLIAGSAPLSWFLTSA